MSKRIIIFGTNTGVGKTVFSALLCKELKGTGFKVAYVKPVQTGYPTDNDALTVREISGLSEKEAFSVVKEREPVAPAALFDRIPLDRVLEKIEEMESYDYLIIETVGGVCSPLDKSLLNYHLSKILKSDFNIVVVPNRLGCINDALLVNYLFSKEGIGFAFALDNYFMEDKNQKNEELIDHFTKRVTFVFNRHGFWYTKKEFEELRDIFNIYG